MQKDVESYDGKIKEYWRTKHFSFYLYFSSTNVDGSRNPRSHFHYYVSFLFALNSTFALFTIYSIKRMHNGNLLPFRIRINKRFIARTKRLMQIIITTMIMVMETRGFGVFSGKNA